MLIKNCKPPIKELKTRSEHLRIKIKEKTKDLPILTNGLQGSLAPIFVFEWLIWQALSRNKGYYDNNFLEAW